MDLSDFSAPLRIRLIVPTLGFLALGIFVSAAKAAPPGPPPEAIAACASSKEGDACTVKLGDHSIDGTCTKHGDVVACRPNGPPPEQP